MLKKREEHPATQEVLNRLEALTEEVTKLRGKQKGRGEAIRLSDEVKKLKHQITDLEISKSKREEDNERQLREVEHKVGLEKLRGEAERDIAVKEAELAVREGNLSREREAFEKEMEFTRTRMTEEVDRITALQEQILKRLPVVTVDKQITDNGNGAAKEVEHA